MAVLTVGFNDSGGSGVRPVTEEGSDNFMTVTGRWLWVWRNKTWDGNGSGGKWGCFWAAFLGPSG
jgi:hypothetical protein